MTTEVATEDRLWATGELEEGHVCDHIVAGRLVGACAWILAGFLHKPPPAKVAESSGTGV